MVSWCFKGTFSKRYIVERTNAAELDQKNRVRKRRVVGRIYGMKGHKDRNRHKNRIRSEQVRLVLVQNMNHIINI